MQVQQVSSDATSKRKPLSEFVKKVWENTFLHCKTLIKQLQDLSVRYPEVDKYFDHLNMEQVQSNLEDFCDGMCECDESSVASKNSSWIQDTVEHIKRHRLIKQYAETAQVFLSLKQCLHLSGDFGDIKSLSDQVNILIFTSVVALP